MVNTDDDLLNRKNLKSMPHTMVDYPVTD